MRTGVCPVFWQATTGHDFVLYDRLLVEARFFRVGTLVHWLEEQEYLGAVEVTRSMRVSEGDEIPQNKTGRGSLTQWIPMWKANRVYICPRGIAVHHGDINRCGRQCRNAQDDSGPKYAKEMELTMVSKFSGLLLRFWMIARHLELFQMRFESILLLISIFSRQLNFPNC